MKKIYPVNVSKLRMKNNSFNDFRWCEKYHHLAVIKLYLLFRGITSKNIAWTVFICVDQKLNLYHMK